MRFLFSFFFSGRFFKLNGDLPAIYCDKNPQVVFILFFSARNICFWSVMLRFDEFFFFLHNVPENVFFLLFRNFRKRKYSIQKPEMTYMTFLQMNSSAGLRSDSEIHLVAQFIVFLFFLFMFV